MGTFELRIYGANDEILKTFATDRIRWAVFLQAISIHEEIAASKPEKQYELIGEFIKKLFPGITDADIGNADAQDVLNTFWMLVGKANQIGGRTKKN